MSAERDPRNEQRPAPYDCQRLKAAREAAGLTQSTAAATAGITQGYWSEVEAGQHVPALATLAAMARAVGIPLHDLVEQ